MGASEMPTKLGARAARAERSRPWTSLHIALNSGVQQCVLLPAPGDACCKFFREYPPPRGCELLAQRQRSTTAAQCQRPGPLAIEPHPASMKVGDPFVTAVASFDVDSTGLDTDSLAVVRMAGIHQAGDAERGQLTSTEDHHERIAGDPEARTDDGHEQGERADIAEEGGWNHGAVARELPGNRLHGRGRFLRRDGGSGWRSRHRREPSRWMPGLGNRCARAPHAQDRGPT
jgi:hypothetical protein